MPVRLTEAQFKQLGQPSQRGVSKSRQPPDPSAEPPNPALKQVKIIPPKRDGGFWQVVQIYCNGSVISNELDEKQAEARRRKIKAAQKGSKRPKKRLDPLNLFQQPTCPRCGCALVCQSCGVYHG